MIDVLQRVHTHMPYTLFPRYLPMILEKKLNPEIYFSHYALQSLDKNQCIETAQTLKDAGLKVTFHAPFMDLRPDAAGRRTSYCSTGAHQSGQKIAEKEKVNLIFILAKPI